MRKSSPEESMKKDLRTSDSDGDGDNDWDKALHRAVRLKVGKSEEDPEGVRLSLIKAYLNEGANINVQDRNGDTVLHVAVRKGFGRIVEFLRQRGAKIDIHNYDCATAIGLAETLQEKDIVSILWKADEQINEPGFSRSSDANNSMSAADEQQPSSSRGSDKATEQKSTSVEDDSERIGPREKLHPSVDADSAEKVSGPEEQKTYLAGATLTRSWPGIVYQLKHLVFTLHCALQQRDPHFFLATEMVAAEKLDDVVLLYKNDSGKQVGRFIQIKYTSNQFRKISAKELLDAGGDFSVPSYFASWRKVKKKELFREIEVRNMILCTNMDLDVEDLAKNDICCENTGDPDRTFELRSDQKQTAYYKLSADKESNEKLYSELEAASDVCRLAKLVAKCIYDRSPMRLNMPSFREHHLALAEYVFDVKTKKFHDKFIHNRSLAKNVEEFREIFLTEFRSLVRSSNTDSSEELTWKEIQTRFQKPEFLKGFGKAPEGATDILTEHYLPDDYVDDVEISNFLEEFTLAVNQPNENELNKILREKIDANSGFNLLNIELLDGAFQNKMLDWFVKNDEDTKEKEYLSYIVGEKFFEDMNNEVGSLITIGVNSAYCEQMKEYDIHFKSEMQQVKAFLTDDQSDSTANRILELVAPGETLLTALRVYDTLERIQKYKKMESFIFTRVDSLKFPSILNLIKNTFDSLRYPDLLIVDCGSNGTDQYLQTLRNSLVKIIEKNEEKKIHKKIIIISPGENFATQFTRGHQTYREKNTDLGFRNLTNTTQKKLLEKPVTKFQGHKNETNLGKLLGIREFDNLSADELEDLLEIIDANALIEIIRSDQLELGDDLDQMNTLEHCYINRTICRDVVIKEAILEDKKVPDLIAISGINTVLQGATPRIEESFAMRPNFSTDLFADIGIDRDPPGESVRIGKSPPMAHRPTNFTILDSTRAEEQFNDLCAENRGCNIHWLQKEQERYIWKESQGDITYLVQNRDLSGTDDCNDRTGMTHLSDDQLIFHDTPVIISDAAGMGKSTMLTYLAFKMKENEPDMLVLKIDLNHHSTALSEVGEKSIYDLGITNDAIQFLVKELLSGETNLTRKVFRRIIKRKHKVALIFDGFDEISPTYEDPVIKLMRTLADYGIKKLLVATRPHTRATLETQLKTFSYVIRPFSTYDQERFLTEFWKAQFQDLHHDLQQAAEDRIRKYTRAMMIQLANLIKDHRNKFTGIPLHANMVAEIFGNHSEGAGEYFDSCIEFVNSEVDEPKFPEKINLVYLYENFVQKKFDVFYRKRGGNLADVAVVEDRRQRYKSFIEKHERLALDTLFDKHKITEILLSRQDASDRSSEPADLDIPVERDGIITQFIDGQPRFGHRTYAEYFAAKFFSDMLRKRQLTESSANIFVADILLGENYKTMRAFIDWLLPKEHVDVLQGEFWVLCLKTHRSQQQETIFHVAAAEGNDRIIRLFLDCLHTNSEDRMDLMNERDIFGGMAIHRAVEYGHLDKIKLLAEVTDVKIDSRNGLGFSPLHQAASIANIDIVKYLIQRGADINCQTNDGRNPLHLAAREGKLDVVKYLHGNGADINCQTNDGVTPLHLTAHTGKLDVVKYLHKNGADINCQLTDGVTPMWLAAWKGNLDVIKYLHGNGADINCQSTDGMTPLHVAALEGKLDVVDYLHRNGADINCQSTDGVTPLHVVASKGKLDVIEYLHRNGADIHCQSNNGMTALHMAASEGKLDIVDYLNGIGADINCQSTNGMTPLHVAALEGKLDVVDYLHRNGADINCQSTNGMTPLHVAALEGKLDVVDYLHRNGADINCQSNNGITALHMAASEGKLDIVDYLNGIGADINCQSNIGLTPLHLAASQGELDVVKYLHGHGADINCRMNDGRTALHLATRDGKLDVVKYLHGKGADINCQQHSGATPLHSAARKGLLELVEYLHRNGADNNCQTNAGVTSLHLAAEEGKLDVVEYLHGNGADINCQSNIGLTPLHLAASQGELDVVKYLHGHGADINCQLNSGATPLHLAAHEGKLDVVEYLHSNGADINCQTNEDMTPLHLAAQKGNLDLVRSLFEKGAQLDSQMMYGLTPLGVAAISGKWDVVAYLTFMIMLMLYKAQEIRNAQV